VFNIGKGRVKDLAFVPVERMVAMLPFHVNNGKLRMKAKVGLRRNFLKDNPFNLECSIQRTRIRRERVGREPLFGRESI
jgi:hypothetical protein